MQRALDLASMGLGKVSPNPMVGCVIVYKDRIIGEGYHRHYSGSHAEVNAINSVKEKNLLPKSILYTTLEPCCHYGKTPPCTQLLIKENIKNVVVCNTDPNPLVNGKGLKILKDSGIKVTTGILANKGQRLNRRFFKFIKKKSPFVILKWAETADGFIAKKNFESKWISNRFSRKLVHRWRAQEDAVMIGTNTAYYDNPQLTVRNWKGNNPIRIVIDKNLRLKKNLYIFDGNQTTLCYNLHRNDIKGKLSWIRINKKHPLKQILEDLYFRKIQSVMVEGGKQLLQSFINENLWDEIRLFKSDISFHEGISSPIFRGTLTSSDYIENDRIETYFPI